MNTVHAQLIGRFGNQLFQYAMARALAEERGYNFSCPKWIGDQLFDLNEPATASRADSAPAGSIVIRDYCQRQECLIYTREQVKRWFTLKPTIKAMLDSLGMWANVVAHRRVGDYAALGYVVVSMQSYIDAMEKFNCYGAFFVTEESPSHPSAFPDMPFLPDFYRLMSAKVIFRGNSSFSWWSATLSDAQIYSPVIEGLEGGKEQDCRFVLGNWPRLANLPYISDLHLPEA